MISTERIVKHCERTLVILSPTKGKVIYNVHLEAGDSMAFDSLVEVKVWTTTTFMEDRC